MKIIYHFRVRGVGVEGVHIAGIVKAFRKMGHAVTLVSPIDCDPTGDGDRRAPVSLRAAILHALADRAPQWLFEFMEICYNFSACRKLRRAAATAGAGLIYERCAFFNMAGAHTARRLGLPLIVEVNELSGPERVRPQTFTRLARWCEHRLLRQANLIVAVSPFLARRAAAITGRPEKIMVVPNGVDRAWLNAVTPAPRRRELRARLHLSDAPVMGFAGGLVHWHNLDAMLRVAAGLRDTCPDLQLVLIGDGPLRKTLEDTARALDMADMLRITGAVPHAVVREYLDILDLALIPHANEYRSPVKLFEYMGAGRAVLAPRTEPIAAVIEDENDGILFTPLDYREMREKIPALLANPARREELGRNARRKIENAFLWEHHAGRILANCCLPQHLS